MSGPSLTRSAYRSVMRSAQRIDQMRAFRSSGIIAACEVTACRDLSRHASAVAAAQYEFRRSDLQPLTAQQLVTVARQASQHADGLAEAGAGARQAFTHVSNVGVGSVVVTLSATDPAAVVLTSKAVDGAWVGFDLSLGLHGRSTARDVFTACSDYATAHTSWHRMTRALVGGQPLVHCGDDAHEPVLLHRCNALAACPDRVVSQLHVTPLSHVLAEDPAVVRPALIDGRVTCDSTRFAPGQLEHAVATGSWFVVAPSTTAGLLDVPHDAIWRAASAARQQTVATSVAAAKRAVQPSRSVPRRPVPAHLLQMLPSQRRSGNASHTA